MRIHFEKSRVISFLLCMTLIVGNFGFIGVSHAADEPEPAKVKVRIVDSSDVYVTKQALTVNRFDLKPFITFTVAEGAENYGEPTVILSAHALIEAVYFKLYGVDPDAADLDVDEDSTTATAIKEVCHIVDGVYIGSLFSNSSLGMSVINDNGGGGIGADIITSGDDIVFYEYIDDKYYSYFEVLAVNAVGSYLEMKLRLMYNWYDNNYNLMKSPVENAKIIGDGIWSGSEPVTDDKGIATVELYTSADGSHTFNLSAEGSGIISPYCGVTFERQGGNIDSNSIEVSQRVFNDTSFGTLMVNATGQEVSVIEHANKGRTYSAGNVSQVTLSAIVNDPSATIAAKYKNNPVSFSNTTGGAVSLSLAQGDNAIDMTVKNGEDELTYTLMINAGSFNVETEANRIINGIVNANSYTQGWYDADWILAMAAAGKTISEAQKENFLKNVLVGSSSIGAKAKMVMALSALGIDARQIPVKGSDATLDLVKDIYSTTPSITYDAPYMLMMMDLGIYDIPSGAMWTREKLIQEIINNDKPTGWWEWGTDGAAMAIQSLAVYSKNAATGVNGISAASCAAIKDVVGDTLEEFKTRQGGDGNFPGYCNSDAVIIMALASLGIDANGEKFTKNSSSLIQSMIVSFGTDDNRLGYDNKKYNEVASKQGLQALVSYLNYYKNGALNGNGNIFSFSRQVTPYTNWPDAKLLTGLMLTPPTKTSYTTDDTAISTEGMHVYAVYNGDSATRQEIQGGYTVSTVEFAITGTKTVTVSYQGHSNTFVIYVGAPGGGGSIPDDVAKVSLTVKDNKGKIIASGNNLMIEEGKTTPLDVLKTVLSNANMSVTIKNGAYVAEIDGLGEFDNGPNTGWLFSVNGQDAGTIAANKYTLSNGDTVLWYYTLDYTKDPGSKAWGGGAAENPKDESAVVKEITAKADANGNAVANITNTDITEALSEAAKQEGKNNLLFEIKAGSGATSFETTIPTDALKKVAENKDISLTIDTAQGEITFDPAALASILNAASGSEIKIVVAAKEAEDGRPVFELLITDSKGNVISSFGTGKVTVGLPYVLKTDEKATGVLVYHKKSDGTLTEMKTSYDEKTKKAVFETGHFSTYIVAYDAARANVNFEDVKKSNWYYENVMYLVGKGIIQGKSQTIFAPNDNITRAEFTAILARMSGESLPQAAETFGDVPAESWYAKTVTWAVTAGVAKGVNETVFAPNDNITRQDLAAMLARYAAYKKVEMAEKNKEIQFIDAAEISDYAEEAIRMMQIAGIVNGIQDKDGTSRFAPKNNATRAEAATMIANFLKQ